MSDYIDYDELLGPDVAHDIVERVLGLREEAESHYSYTIENQRVTRLLVEGRWASVFPDDVSELDLPMTANLFRLTVEEVGRLFRSVVPTERVFPSKEGDPALAAAEVREKVLNGYTTGSREFEAGMQELRGMDIAGAAYTAIKTWPDFTDPLGQPIPARRRFPRFSRLDPLNVLPEVNWRPEEPTHSVIVRYTDSLERMKREYPLQHQRLLAAIAYSQTTTSTAREVGYDIVAMAEKLRAQPKLETIELWSTREIIRVACYTFEGKTAAELLFYRENPTGLCPIQLVARPSWGSRPIGQLDDVRGPVRAKNRAFRILLDYFIEMVYGGKLAWNVKNPKDRGPNTVYWAMGPDAKMESVTPNSPTFMALSLFQQMDTEARAGAIFPSAVQGDVDLNKATAAFLTGAQGQLRALVESAHASYASGKQFANVVAFEIDKWLCQAGGKEITGMARGRRFFVTYDPKRDIGEDTANVVRHGAASGLDIPTWSVLMQNKYAAGMASLEQALEADPNVEDVPVEMARIHADKMGEAVIAGLEQLPFNLRAKALVAITQGKTLAEVADLIQQAQDAAQAANPLAAVAAAGGGQASPPALGSPTGIPGTEGSQAPALPPRALLRAG